MDPNWVHAPDVMMFHPRLKVILCSRGLKTCGGLAGLPPSFYYMDCRGVPDGTSQFQSGDDPKCQAWIKANTEISLYEKLIMSVLSTVETRRRDYKDPYAEPVRITFFCAFGMHRSRGMKNIIGQFLRGAGVNVTIENGYGPCQAHRHLSTSITLS